MPLISYVPRQFSEASEEIIERSNVILDEYAAQGFDLTLRQLFYQFVARGWIDNTQRSYKRLGSVVSDARLAGRIDWSRLVDRTRNLQAMSHWDGPEDIIVASAQSYRRDKWEGQPWRVEVWIEKEALAGVIEPPCQSLDVDFFACRGYVSQSEMWGAGQRLNRYLKNQNVTILHLGDHDPSGIDMTRDIRDRLDIFCGIGRVEVKRIALNMDQIKTFGPPPNPTKLSDSRAPGYIRAFGNESWELDALNPTTLAGLIREGVDSVRDEEMWECREDQERAERSMLEDVSRRWDDIGEFLRKND